MGPYSGVERSLQQRRPAGPQLLVQAWAQLVMPVRCLQDFTVRDSTRSTRS
jgi:hypothetical protein